jgi:uncharacterized protein YuzE
VKAHYHADTDSLYIDMSDRISVDSVEVADGVVIDLDADGMVVGIDIDGATRFVDLSRVVVEGFACPVQALGTRVTGGEAQALVGDGAGG